MVRNMIHEGFTIYYHWGIPITVGEKHVSLSLRVFPIGH